ncbi:hypothetical protein V6N11_052881 [Hibiscus sabdariffa]|uniref:RNase H type-1 domain-containing protein n=1 Tax=Hibiscus sabdariffa TaxID=183260 RepID=A0ABR2UBS7_9ROSI
MLGDGSAGGIDEIIHSYNDNVVMSFSESVGSGPTILVELLVLKFELTLYGSLESCKMFRLIVDNNSKMAINWVVDPILCHRNFRHLVHEFVSLGIMWDQPSALFLDVRMKRLTA